MERTFIDHPVTLKFSNFLQKDLPITFLPVVIQTPFQLVMS